MKILANPDEVTVEWLNELLKHADIDAEVASFSARQIGTGQVGDNVRFTLSYSSGSGPASIVGKFPSSDAVSRATGSAQNNYFKEVMFYRELRHTVQIQTPDVLFTNIDPLTQDFCLMMQDMAPGQQGNQLEGCSESDAHTAVRELAKLHGPRWNDPTLADIEWLQVDEAARIPFFMALWAQVLPGFLERYTSRLSNAHLQLLNTFSDRVESYVAPNEGPNALQHGDYRLDNMLFGGPYRLAVVDWQTVSIGHPAQDLAYFTGAGLLPAQRRAVEQALVDEYYNQLAPYDCLQGYSREQCFKDYRRFSFSGLVMAVIASMIVGQTERGDDMFMAMASRHAQQAIDLDALDLLH